MSINSLSALGGTQGRPELFQLRLEKARQAAVASNQEFIAAAEQAGQTAHADFSRVSYAQIANQIGAADGVIYTTDLQKLADLATADAERRVSSALRQSDLGALRPAPKFSVGRDGQLAIDHPRKAEIEAAFARDATLSQDLRDAINLQGGAARTQADSLYAQAYQRTYASAGAEAAGALAQRYGGLGGPNATLTFEDGRLSTQIDGGSITDYLGRVAGRLGIPSGGLANLRA